MDLFSLPPNPLTEFLSDPDNFVFRMKLEKSAPSSGGKWWIQGVASAEMRDEDGETLLQKGIICEPLLRKGLINWDHKDSSGGPRFIVGEPVEAEVVPASRYADRFGKSVSGLATWVRGFLYQDAQRKPLATDIWNHLQCEEVSPERQLSWSVQGRVLERDPRNNQRIVKCELRHLALTHQPVQPYTFAEIAKSFSGLTTHTSQPLLRENLNGKMTSLLYGECKKGCYSDDMKFKKGIGGAMRHLVECHHKDLRKSAAFLQALKDQDYQF